jgi:uncharacterized protein (TIGR00725 family)
MKLKVGVMGSATGTLSRKQKELAYELGRAIAQNDCIIITGACPGLPLESARGATEAGGLVVGISPALSEWEHVNRYHSPVSYHDVHGKRTHGKGSRQYPKLRHRHDHWWPIRNTG